MGGLWWTNRRHWWEQVDYILIESHLSEPNGPCQAWTWMAGLTDRDANHYAISPSPTVKQTWCCCTRMLYRTPIDTASHLVTFHSQQRVNRPYSPCLNRPYFPCLTFECQLLSKEAPSTILKVLGMSRTGFISRQAVYHWTPRCSSRLIKDDYKIYNIHTIYSN